MLLPTNCRKLFLTQFCCGQYSCGCLIIFVQSVFFSRHIHISFLFPAYTDDDLARQNQPGSDTEENSTLLIIVNYIMIIKANPIIS